MPLLFFHGIAPSGLVLYLPMLLFGLATERERPVFLFENPSISFCIDFYPLTEEHTVDGIVELVEGCLGQDDQPLSVVGHSFGSCPITWLLACPKISKRVQQVVLLGPVAIRLSEPDIMVNFLYAREWDKIRVVASSELFTEWNIISDRTSHGTIVNCGCKICKNNIDCWCVYRTRRNFECSQSTARAGTACFELASCAAADDRVLEGSWSWRLYLVATQMEANQRADAATRIGCIATNETVTLPERTTFGDTRNCGSIVF